MISSIGSSQSMFSLSQLQERMFLKADTNGDGTIDVGEMSAMQANASRNDAGSEDLFVKLDTDADGVISRAESDAAIAKMFYGMPPDGAAQSSASSAARSGAANDPGQRLTDLFGRIDTNGDGSVTQEEFVAGRPDEISEEQAAQMWSELDPGGSGSLTESQFTSAMANPAPPQGPPPGPPPGGFGHEEDSSPASSGSTATTSASSTSGSAGTSANSELLQALLTAIGKYLSTMEQSSSSAAATSTAANSLSLEA